MTAHLELDRETVRAKEPARAWRNKWLAIRAGEVRCNTCERVCRLEDGEYVLSHCRVFPSKEIAEQAAREATVFNQQAIHSWLKFVASVPVEAA